MREIPGYPGYYVTEDGDVFSMRSVECRPLVKQLHKGYYHVFVKHGFGRKTKVKMPVHQLVLMAYVGPKPFAEAVTRHLNGNCLDNHISNLMWGTVKENVQDSLKHKTAACIRLGELHPCSKLKKEDVLAIRTAVFNGTRQIDIAKQYAISSKHVSDIKLGRTWKHLWGTQGASNPSDPSRPRPPGKDRVKFRRISQGGIKCKS